MLFFPALKRIKHPTTSIFHYFNMGIIFEFELKKHNHSHASLKTATTHVLPFFNMQSGMVLCF
ncbi:hypothetical protein EDWATA_00231 [Edwardsiella tarda ATCC 23685]|uniref:Uncharacterized protein n=1 Tax=Edwardsiella tarda ATCC 23685 TaxID=500638 RepID=D4F0K6_EDWTA|nr:hypothetical protein EDWATA_00231 [Edwardsiella tarda ATCC 23685]